MKLSVVACDCRNPKHHVKLQSPSGERTDGIFSLARGRRIIEELKDRGEMSAEEVAETDAELTATGLPEFPVFDDRELETAAIAMIAIGQTSAEIENQIAENVADGMVSPADANRLREIVTSIIELVALPTPEAVSES